MDVGVLVRTLVLDEVVDVHTHFASLCFCVVHANHNARCVNVVNHAATSGSHHSARVDRGNALDTGTNHWFFWTQHGHGLT